jgi:hypothetical protein
MDVPDFIFSLACKPQDKAKGIVKGFNIKTRDGTDGQVFHIRVDRSTSTFTIIEEYEFNKLSEEGGKKFDDDMNDALRKARIKAKKSAQKDGLKEMVSL